MQLWISDIMQEVMSHKQCYPEQVTMMMEFQAIDAILPAGHGINIVFTESGEDYLAPACGPSCTVHILPSLSQLSIPQITSDSGTVLITPQNPDAANN